jgi:type II secretory pathway component PulF
LETRPPGEGRPVHLCMSSVSRAPGSFLYVAATARGGRKFGVRQATSARLLAEGLRKDRLLLLRSWALPRALSPQKSTGLKDQAAFNDVLGQLLTRGVPLVEALEVTASAVGPGMKPAVAKMRELVAAGSSFADACERTGVFDRVTTSVYRAAERTGELGAAAQQLSRTMRRQLAVSGKAVTLLIYPAIVLTVSMIVSVGMLTFIVPRIGEALAEAGAKLPWFSRLVMGTGGFLREHGLWVLAGVVALLVAAVIARKVVGAAIWRVARRLPGMGELIVAQELARFFSVMAAMTRSGIPLADALGVGNGAVGHPALKKQLSTVQTKLIEGGSLPLLIENATALPLATRRLLVAAERSGELETAFDNLGADMADEVDRRSTRLLHAMEPLLIVVMFLMVGTLVLAIMVPMLTVAAGDFGK